MTLNKLTYIVLELNAALDAGKYDHVPLREASQHIDAGDIIPWLTQRVPNADLSLLAPEDIAEYQAGLADILGAYEGRERRKWGVERRALCLLIAWTIELIQRRSFNDLIAHRATRENSVFVEPRRARKQALLFCP